MTAQPLLPSSNAPLPAGSNSAQEFDDLPSIRLFKVPDAAPPFDGEFPAPSEFGAHFETPFVPPPRTPIPPPEATGSGGPVGLGDWPSRFARLLTEVLSGSRPSRQIMPCLTRRARFHLNRLTPIFSSSQRLRVLRVLASQPSATVVEMSVIVDFGTRTRALALRLERAMLADQSAVRWLCTDIEAG
jgi:hypothetical protein